MVELEYVKRRKRNKIVAIVTAISSVVLVAFIIISFLGDKVGSFTINLKNSDVKLSLALHEDFRDKTSYLLVENMLPLDCYCYQDFKNGSGEMDYTEIDNENTTYLDWATKHPDTGKYIAAPFFKYTFYVGNEGTTTATYAMQLKIISNTADPSTGKFLDEILRVILIEDGSDRGIVYAKKSSDGDHYDPTIPVPPGGIPEYTDYEYVCGWAKNYPDKWEGLAQPFLSGTLLFDYTVTNLKAGEHHRYTLLYWLEGDDPECKGIKPLGSKIRLGVDINAYAN